MGDLSDAAFAGVHMSEQGDLSDRSQADVWWECVKGAVADAGLDLADLDGLTGRAPHGVGIRDALPGGAVAAMIGRPLRFHAITNIGAAGTASLPTGCTLGRAQYRGGMRCRPPVRVCPGGQSHGRDRRAGGRLVPVSHSWAVSAQRQIPHVDASSGVGQSRLAPVILLITEFDPFAERGHHPRALRPSWVRFVVGTIQVLT